MVYEYRVYINGIWTIHGVTPNIKEAFNRVPNNNNVKTLVRAANFIKVKDTKFTKELFCKNYHL